MNGYWLKTEHCRDHLKLYLKSIRKISLKDMAVGDTGIDSLKHFLLIPAEDNGEKLCSEKYEAFVPLLEMRVLLPSS